MASPDAHPFKSEPDYPALPSKNTSEESGKESVSEEHNEEGKLIRRSRMELLDYGYGAADRGRKGWRRQRVRNRRRRGG